MYTIVPSKNQSDGFCHLSSSSSTALYNVELLQRDLKEHSSKDVTFRVLSYNILADYLATSGSHRHFYCPDWALSWECRQQNLLYGILEYDADILCVQEVQKDHFENFLKPELAKYGYSVIHKKKKFEGSDPCTFIRKGRVEILPIKKTDQSGILQTHKLSHSLNLVSACATFFQSNGVEDHQR